MGLKSSIPFILLLLLFNTTASFGQSPDIQKLEKAVGIVQIYDYNGQYIGHGSGFMISSDGTLVTNYHVIDGAHSLKVVLEENGRRVKYDVQNIVKGSKSKDLAILKIRNIQKKQFSYLKISQQPPKKGDECWAIGTPADPLFINTVSKGLVSNLINSGDPRRIQMNAGIAHGSSGGALLNTRGEAIGVTQGGWGDADGARAGINWAIRIEEIKMLPAINKKSVIDPVSIPCEISFYTKNRHDGDLYMYVDGNYIGVFNTYFSNSVPTCGDNGTITKTLYSGVHSYRIYSKNRGCYIYSGSVDLIPGQCKIFNVTTAVYPKYPNGKVKYTTSGTNKPRPKIWKYNKGLLDLRVFTYLSGSTPYSSNRYDGFPLLAFGIEKEINDKMSILLKYQNIAPYTASNLEDDLDGKEIDKRKYRHYDVNNDFKCFIIDMKIYEYENDESSGWWGPSFALISLKKTETWYSAVRVGNFDFEEEVMIDYPLKWGLGYGIRGGWDKFITKRIILSTDIVLMKCTKSVIDLGRFDDYVIKPKAAGLNINIGLGYRLNKRE
ncbi:MAG: S1C family serine protease [Bacteroidia bacterium]|jgi:serine protease Do|nr:S1C family serine protease [Bacteroidia bacterium]